MTQLGDALAVPVRGEGAWVLGVRVVSKGGLIHGCVKEALQVTPHE